MSEQEQIAHHVVIYTTHLRLRGEISLSPLRRLSDIVNDMSFPFMLLERSLLTILEGGNVTNLEQVAVSKENVLALLLEPDSPLPAPAKKADRVSRDLQMMSVFAPPFLLSGYMHIAPKAHWLHALNSLRLNFINFTDVILYDSNRRGEIESGMPFAMVNRKYVTALRPATKGLSMSVRSNKENKILVAL